MASAGSGVVIDIDLDQQWLGSLRRRVEGARLRRHHSEDPCTIFRVPLHMRKGDPVAYEPKIISFGPYCRDNPALEPMEQHKLRYVQRLLLRNRNKALDDYVDLIRRLEVRSRACYCEDIHMDSHKFVEMMLLDGCFFVEFLLNTHSFVDKEEDPVLTTYWASPLITYDMLMLENQIPFFIIEEVFKLATYGSLTDLLLLLFRDLLPIERTSSPPDTTFYHVLHFVHSCIMPFKSEQPVKPPARTYLRRIRLWAPNIFRQVISNESSGSSPGTPESVPCATMLRDAGVKFREKKASSFLEVAFHNGTMEIPMLHVQDSTNSLFRNLIAFEQCFPMVGTKVVTYVRLMDCLVDSGEDVALLRRHGCIESILGSDEDVAQLFNRLGKDVLIDTTDSCYLASVFKDVKKHRDSRWHKYRAKLKRDYFSNPWAFLSLLGALTIILLTALQTLFAILAYFKPPLAS